MANPAKQKGTAGETDVKRKLNESGFRFERTEASCTYDLRQEGTFEDNALEVLVGRADRSEWLITLRLDDFRHLLWAYETACGTREREPQEVHVEVKRYQRIAWHNIFRKKFG